MKKVAIILAGGIGARLWPKSTASHPKQFMSLIGEKSLVRQTYDRLLQYLPKEDIFVVTYSSLEKLTVEQLPDLPKSNLILEPFGRNTLPALLLTHITIKNKYSSDDVFLTIPSDHIIKNDAEFFASLDLAAETASQTKGIASIGITPTRPGTQYGYVQINEDKDSLGELFDKGVRQTNVFAEKPDMETAKRFIESGDFLWNTGIFAVEFNVFADKLEKYLPEYFAQFKNLSQYLFSEYYVTSVEFTYKQINSISIDYGLMEKTDDLFIIPGKFGWSDLGNWDELYRLSMKDSRNNYFEGDVIGVDTSNSIVMTNKKTIGLVGVSDLVVIESDDAVFICKRGESERVKEIIDQLRRQNLNKLL